MHYIVLVIITIIIIIIIILLIILTNECSGGRRDNTFSGIDMLEEVYMELEFFYLLCYR